MKVLKPYDLQVRDDTSLFYNEVDYDDEVDYWVAHRDTPVVNILVGPTGCGKSTYIEKMGLTGISFPGIPLYENKVINQDKKINIIEENNFKKREFRSYIKNEAKDAGKIRLEGKEYIVKDGDILNFRFNT